MRPLSMFESAEPPPASLRKNQSSDDLVRDGQVRQQNKIMRRNWCSHGFMARIHPYNVHMFYFSLNVLVCT